MVFSSPIFLFLFLPIVLVLYFTIGRWFRNLVLLAVSLFFYAWGEQEIVLVMLASIAGNFALGLGLERCRLSALARTGSEDTAAPIPGRRAKLLVAVAVVFNLGLLVAFKYANWIWDLGSRTLLSLGLSETPLPPIGRAVTPLLQPLGLLDGPLADDWHIRLPIGISFFTFQAMSYVIDVYRRDGPAQRNPINFAVYIALFPQLIAGPIVRYRDIAVQIAHRIVDREGFAHGIRRFTVGLGKKMLVANVAAVASDAIFALPEGQIDAPTAWLGIVCYAIQIYFDFSGYSDMAIGLGRMFGFHFLENFNYPYISQSITEFWRRWHISLSSWFRDYLYIPLGGNRGGPLRTYANLVIVFFLCGLWHGASGSFVFWGLFHGAFLVIERIGLKRVLERAPRVVRHVYLLVVVLVGWVFFNARDLDFAFHFLGAMAGFAPEDAGSVHHAGLYLDSLVATALVAGTIGAMPWLPRLLAWRADLGSGVTRLGLDAAGLVLTLAVLLLSAMEMTASSYNPFIYFRF